MRDEDLGVSGFGKSLKAKLGSKPIYGLLIATPGLISLVVILWAGGYPDPKAPDGESFYGWAAALFFPSILATAFGLTALLEWDSRRRFARGDRGERIRRLTESLKEALQAINSIQAEIDEGNRVLRQLEKDLAAKKHAAELSSEEAAAVQRLVQIEFQRERKSGYVRDLMFMLAGVAIGYFLEAGAPPWVPWVG